jgi:hypothetical protein
MANTIDWGKATQNNTNGFGKYQNTINAGDIYAESWAGETVIIGTSAAFTYAKSSYHQDESDPTPTITGTSGGTFSGTSGIVFVDSGTNSGSSTGQVDLSASTIQANTITYTVSGVSANFSLSVTASPFLANTYSMQFDGVNDYIETGNAFTSLTSFSISAWFKSDDTATAAQAIVSSRINSIGTSKGVDIYLGSNTLVARIYNNGATEVTTAFTDTSNWHQVVITYNGTTLELFLDNVSQGTATGVYNNSAANWLIGKWNNGPNYFNGKLDEVAFWNTALSADAVQEIYNATNNNSGKALDLTTSSGNYSSADASALQYFNRMGD